MKIFATIAAGVALLASNAKALTSEREKTPDASHSVMTKAESGASLPAMAPVALWDGGEVRSGIVRLADDADLKEYNYIEHLSTLADHEAYVIISLRTSPLESGDETAKTL